MGLTLRSLNVRDVSYSLMHTHNAQFTIHIARAQSTMRNAVEIGITVAVAIAVAVAVAAAVNEMRHCLLEDVAILCVPQQDACAGQQRSGYGHVAPIAHMAISSRSLKRQQQHRR